MITQNISTLKIHKLTKEQYERELEAGSIDENAIYLTPDDPAKSIVAGENITIAEIDSQVIISAAAGMSSDSEINGGNW